MAVSSGRGELRIAPTSSADKPQWSISVEEGKIITLLDEPCFIDTIIQKTGLPAPKVSAVLLDMELKGLIEQQTGKQFIKKIYTKSS